MLLAVHFLTPPMLVMFATVTLLTSRDNVQAMMLDGVGFLFILDIDDILYHALLTSGEKRTYEKRQKTHHGVHRKIAILLFFMNMLMCGIRYSVMLYDVKAMRQMEATTAERIWFWVCSLIRVMLMHSVYMHGKVRQAGIEHQQAITRVSSGFIELAHSLATPLRFASLLAVSCAFTLLH